MITIYADGACSGNPGPAGSAIILFNNDMQPIREQMKPLGHGTNNIAELNAALMAIKAAIETDGVEFNVRCDSEYVVRGINEWMTGWIAKGWKNASKKPIANVELWKEIEIALREATAAFKEVRFEWVKGHGKDQFNNAVDRLAVRASRMDVSVQAAAPAIPVPPPIAPVIQPASAPAPDEVATPFGLTRSQWAAVQLKLVNVAKSGAGNDFNSAAVAVAAAYAVLDNLSAFIDAAKAAEA